MRQKMLLLGALFFGVLSGILTYNLIDSEKKRIRGEASEIYVCQLTRALAGNDEIKDDDLRFIFQILLQAAIDVIGVVVEGNSHGAEYRIEAMFKLGILKGEYIRFDERDIVDAILFQIAAGDIQHGFGKIDPDNFAFFTDNIQNRLEVLSGAAEEHQYPVTLTQIGAGQQLPFDHK